MGLLSDLFSAITGDGSSNVSSDPKATSYSINDDGDARVRNTDVVIDHDKGTHDTMWSNSTYDGKTGEFGYNEGAHGPNFKA